MEKTKNDNRNQEKSGNQSTQKSKEEGKKKETNPNNPIANQTITAVTNPNGSITLQDLISASLPSGHTFNHMDVILEDDLGGAFIKTIAVASNSVTFNHGDGNLVLNNSNPNRTYFVTLVLYTNLCSNGNSYSFTIKY